MDMWITCFCWCFWERLPWSWRWITARYYGRSTSVYSGETYLCLCFNRGSNRLCGAVSEFWCSGVNGRSVSSSYIGQIPCGTLQMESSKAYPRRIVKKKYNHKYRKISPSVEELFFSAKKGDQYIFYREIIQEAVCPEVLRILLHRYGS